MSNWSTLSHHVLFAMFFVWPVSCFPEGYDRCGDGYQYHDKTGNCIKIEEKDASSGAKPQDGGSDGDNGIGSPCSCEGEECSIAGIPTITRGTILGCENVPKDWTGAELACLQSFTSDFSLYGYYAQGFCSLLAMGCSGDDIVCSQQMGEFEAMTSCPEGNVLLTFESDIRFASLNTHLKYKYCVPNCEQDADCRIDDFDEVLDEPGQYQCLDKDGVMFCFDPRNLPDDYFAEAF